MKTTAELIAAGDWDALRAIVSWICPDCGAKSFTKRGYMYSWATEDDAYSFFEQQHSKRGCRLDGSRMLPGMPAHA